MDVCIRCLLLQRYGLTLSDIVKIEPNYDDSVSTAVVIHETHI